MFSGKKSDLKNHLSAKHPTWAHKVMARRTHEQTGGIECHQEPLPERDPPLRAERSQPIPIRY
jgi:hypothetical protein